MSVIDIKKDADAVRSASLESVLVWREVWRVFELLNDKKEFNRRNFLGIVIRDEMLIFKGFDSREIHLRLATGEIVGPDRMVAYIDMNFGDKLNAKKVLEAVQTIKVMEEDGRLVN